jgi:hypothetical protein
VVNTVSKLTPWSPCFFNQQRSPVATCACGQVKFALAVVPLIGNEALSQLILQSYWTPRQSSERRLQVALCRSDRCLRSFLQRTIENPLSLSLSLPPSMVLQYFAPSQIFQFPNLIQSRWDSLDGGSVRRKAATYTQNNTKQNKRTQTSMPRSTIPAFERAKTFHALDRAATVIGPIEN